MTTMKATKRPQVAVDQNATQLTSTASFDPKRIVFSELSVSKIPDSTLTCSRIFLSIKNPDGSVGDLIVPTPEIWSPGPSDNINVSTKQKDGYKMPLALFSKNGATAEEKQFVDVFNAIAEKCKDHCFDNKDELGLEIEGKNELRKMNPIWYKKENKKIVDGALPYLYCKIWIQKERTKKDGTVEPEKVKTAFYHASTGEEINMFEIYDKPCHVRAAIKFESIFIGGNNAYLQVKLYECLVKPMGNGGLKRLFEKPEVQVSREVVDETQAETTPVKRNIFENLNDDSGSIKDEEEDSSEESEDSVTIDQEPTPEPEPPKVIKKVIRRVVKKKE